MDGAIDPNVIRQRVNPISEAAPVTHEDALYGIDSTMTNSSDSVDLVQKARNGLYNYKNRFNALPPSDKSANPISSDLFVAPPSTAFNTTTTPYKSQAIDVLAGVKKGSGRPTGGSI
jgi:hypothetical protein